VRFVPGETVMLQEVWRNRVWSARPMTVVRDEDDLVALWFPEDTRFKRPMPPPTRLAHGDRGERLASCLTLGDWVFEDAEWDASTLVLMRPGEWHAVWCSWRDGEHLPWYVNLQEPFRRTSKGFETMDLALDVVVHGDGRWYWKDEDELATFVELGVFDDELATRVRAEGVAVVDRAERNESPFDEPWSQWRPDSSWSLPQLPEGWAERCR
jgi:hypothetical protein